MHGIYLVTDQTLCLGRPLASIVADAVRAGIACVQLREKTASTRKFLNQALALKPVLASAGIPLIINDRVDIALAAGADGVHLGQSDMPYDAARRLMGSNAIIGLSVETWADVEAAQNLDVAYLGVSPVFATPTKTDTRSPWGLDGLARIRAYSRHSLVAIGGLNAANAKEIIRAGADAVAVVSAICSAEDPFTAARNLVHCFDSSTDKET
ncbi:thiamine phosphate synthase [Desulfotignum phosphitoxidans]|jgi:thiamine-phosphate pyrophosphorylase|uniref:Thiamine-phosphate synthase n=2 Tax=Desulfotignum TaxID=115780 RepID=S0FYK8_9BACT|nr:thiamine phosphate synthase [Desulfotignum phosphitoxidans]EMS78249.1 thiamine-phosphate pyrophosphorylase ThiE [Desulfotignum phosphitoxidans DSM 13687]MBG0778779.1 thiamine phosphate synthase [Desulfotignum balticum]